jgi:hypothetical protein
LNALQFFPPPVMVLVAFLVAPMALVAPLFDGLDRERNFTLGFVCQASKPMKLSPAMSGRHCVSE